MAHRKRKKRTKAAALKQPSNPEPSNEAGTLTEIKQIELSDGSKVPVLPMDWFDKVTESMMHLIEPDDLQSAENLNEMILFMHNFPERDYYYFEKKNGEKNGLIRQAHERNMILMNEVEFRFYKRPKYIRDYEKITRAPKDLYDWQRDADSQSIWSWRRPFVVAVFGK